MKVGIGLPAAIRGSEGDDIVHWARRAEERGFSTLGVIDRIAYDSYEPLVTLAVAAAVTERIRLMTSILLAPLRTNPPSSPSKQPASTGCPVGGLSLGSAWVAGRATIRAATSTSTTGVPS